MDIYERCPEFVSPRFLLRQVRAEDWADLLKVYSDPAAVPLFNADNCIGDFHMTREQDMKNCIAFWLQEYGMRYYIRWSVVDRASSRAVGTIELFHRTAEDFYNHVGLLRLDLRSDYERSDAICEILSCLLPPTFGLFDCGTMVTKILPLGHTRREALSRMGFWACAEPLIGHNGTKYWDYYVVEQASFRPLPG